MNHLEKLDNPGEIHANHSFSGPRPRRLRLSPQIRRMVRETELSPADLIYPLFVTHGAASGNEIGSMPGVYQQSPDQLAREAESLASLEIPAVLLFGIPASKDPVGLENFAEDGIVQQSIRAIKAAVPEMVVITDVCLCEYTDHGHCGLLNTGRSATRTCRRATCLNDPTLDVLGRVAVSHAEAGADIVAPSGMMDGMVGAIRGALDDAQL
jgi:porphobilinogen synthase